MAVRLSFCFALTFALASVTSPALAIRLAPGDLLVVDATNQKILHVDPNTGAVDDFAPRGGFSNLISTPRGIASSPEGQVYVTNYDGATLVQIDAATGAQQILEFFSSGIGGPLDLGTHPAGVAVSPAAPGTGGFRDVYVSSQGALYRVERTLFDTTSAMTPYPSGHESSNGLFLALYASGVVQGYIGVGQSVLQFNGGTISTLIDLIGEISGLAWMPFSPFVSRANTTCPSSSNGVAEIAYDQFFFQYVAQDFATGGDLACPGALAATPPDAPVPYFYAIDVGSNPPRIVRVETAGSPPPTEIVATLPGSASYPALAVYVPEPATLPDVEVALAGIATLAIARRRVRG